VDLLKRGIALFQQLSFPTAPAVEILHFVQDDKPPHVLSSCGGLFLVTKSLCEV
jgi:hypothetical protein